MSRILDVLGPCAGNTDLLIDDDITDDHFLNFPQRRPQEHRASVRPWS